MISKFDPCDRNKRIPEIYRFTLKSFNKDLNSTLNESHIEDEFRSTIGSPFTKKKKKLINNSFNIKRPMISSPDPLSRSLYFQDKIDTVRL